MMLLLAELSCSLQQPAEGAAARTSGHQARCLPAWHDEPLKGLVTHKARPGVDS